MGLAVCDTNVKRFTDQLRDQIFVQQQMLTHNGNRSCCHSLRLARGLAVATCRRTIQQSEC